MKRDNKFYLALAGGTILLGILGCLFASRKNNRKKNQELESVRADDSIDFDEENQLSEVSYEPVSSWLL